MLAAGCDRVRDLARFGRAKNEDHPFRWFLQSFQECVKRLFRDLVCLVDDEDFVFVACRPVTNVLPNLAHLVNAAIRSCVDFDDIDGRSGADLYAAGANASRRRCRPLDTVQTARENPGDRRLARSPLSGKNVAVGEAVAFDRIRESFLDMLLSDQLGKILGTILSGDDLIHERDRVRTGAGTCRLLSLSCNRLRRYFARPRVIRGTQAKPLPLLPSEPGGVCSRPLHEARSLTIHYVITSELLARAEHRLQFLAEQSGRRGAPIGFIPRRRCGCSIWLWTFGQTG